MSQALSDGGIKKEYERAMKVEASMIEFAEKQHKKKAGVASRL